MFDFTQGAPRCHEFTLPKVFLQKVHHNTSTMKVGLGMAVKNE